MIRSREKMDAKVTTDRIGLQYIKGKEDRRLASLSWTEGGVKQSMWVKLTCQSSPGIESWKVGGLRRLGVVQCGGFFSLAMDSQAFSGELVWFAPLLGQGKQS
jgi:hypothetical protein